MELSYFRKSTRSYADTLDALKAAVAKSGLSILAEKELRKNTRSIVLACKPEWANVIIDTDHRIAGFLPCSFYVFEKDGDIMVGTGEPSIIRSLVRGGPLLEIAVETEQVTRQIIHEAANVEALKPSDVIVYATVTCPYCTKVKQWLDAHRIEHRVVYVDKDRKAGQEMVEKTGQMGVPVTEVSFGVETESEFIVGFDEGRLADIFASAR